MQLALGLYDEGTRDNLDIIRVVRNAFAHTAVQLTFETPQMAAEVEKLQMPLRRRNAAEVAKDVGASAEVHVGVFVADITARLRHVCFAPKSGHDSDID